MKKHCWILFVISICACSPEPLETRRLVLTGILTSGEGVSNVKVFFSDGKDGSEFYAVNNAQVYLVNQQGVSTALSFDGETYDNSDVIIEEGTTYGVYASAKELLCKAVVVAPSSPELLSMTANPFAANMTNVFAPVFTVGWLDPENHSYLLELEEVQLGDTIRPGEVGTFSENFNGPYENLQLTLTTADFTCYGRHRLHITAIDKAYSNLWLDDEPNIQGMLKNGATNMTNGFGYVAAVSTLVVPIEITP